MNQVEMILDAVSESVNVRDLMYPTFGDLKYTLRGRINAKSKTIQVPYLRYDVRNCVVSQMPSYQEEGVEAAKAEILSRWRWRWLSLPLLL